MSRLSLGIMELLAMSLGVDRRYFKEFFEENESIMRLNYYPTCQRPDETLGTGPHCDPTSLTILHQDEVGGLQVFVDNEWRSIRPNLDAFVVNIGDTFMVRKRPTLSNLDSQYLQHYARIYRVMSAYTSVTKTYALIISNSNTIN